METTKKFKGDTMENFNLNELGIEELEDLIEDAWALKEVRKEDLNELGIEELEDLIEDAWALKEVRKEDLKEANKEKLKEANKKLTRKSIFRDFGVLET